MGETQRDFTLKNMLGCNKGKITPNNKLMLKNQWGYIEPLVNAKTV